MVNSEILFSDICFDFLANIEKEKSPVTLKSYKRIINSYFLPYFKDVKIIFPDETIVIPDVKVVYLVDFITGERKIKKFKVGLNFPNNPTSVDENLGRKINELLREIDFNKDFENFTKMEMDLDLHRGLNLTECCFEFLLGWSSLIKGLKTVAPQCEQLSTQR